MDNLFEPIDDSDQDPFEEGDFEARLLEHLLFIRITGQTKVNFDVLSHRMNDETLTKEEREEARKWLHKTGEEIIDNFRYNVFIKVSINGRRVCNMSIHEDDDQEKVQDMALNIPPILRILDGQSVKEMVYVPLKSLDIIIDNGESHDSN